MATIGDAGRAALVVVDMQVGVMSGTFERTKVIGNAVRAVERARLQGVPVIWVQHESDELPRDSGPWQLVSELMPAPGETRILKKFNSSFEQTDLDATLARLSVSHIVLAGAQTNWCIRATAYGALERGYDLTLLRDAHTTSDIDLGNGTKLDAETVVRDLNIAMKWLEYPGRVNATANADTVDFAKAGVEYVNAP
jgi:nicotinamidase-related amidase